MSNFFVNNALFPTQQPGDKNKTCKRRSQKRPLQIDDWDDFVALIRNWNRPVIRENLPKSHFIGHAANGLQGQDDEVLNVSYTLSLDALPVRLVPTGSTK